MNSSRSESQTTDDRSDGGSICSTLSGGVSSVVSKRSWSSVSRSSYVSRSTPPRKIRVSSPGKICDIKMFVLLIDPRLKIFEMIHISYDSKTTTLGDVLWRIPDNAQNLLLSRIEYVGVCHPNTGTSLTDESQLASLPESSERIQRGEIWVAMPRGYSGSECSTMAKSILQHQNVAKLLPKRSSKSRRSTGSLSSQRYSTRSTGSSSRHKNSFEGASSLMTPKKLEMSENISAMSEKIDRRNFSGNRSIASEGRPRRKNLQDTQKIQSTRTLESFLERTKLVDGVNSVQTRETSVEQILESADWKAALTNPRLAKELRNKSQDGDSQVTKIDDGVIREALELAASKAATSNPGLAERILQVSIQEEMSKTRRDNCRTKQALAVAAAKTSFQMLSEDISVTSSAAAKGSQSRRDKHRTKQALAVAAAKTSFQILSEDISVTSSAAAKGNQATSDRDFNTADDEHEPTEKYQAIWGVFESQIDMERCVIGISAVVSLIIGHFLERTFVTVSVSMIGAEPVALSCSCLGLGGQGIFYPCDKAKIVS
eukprot:scaffold620775_cov59-Attheya_sp.AAC.1